MPLLPFDSWWSPQNNRIERVHLMLLIYTTKPIPLFLISIHTKIIEPQQKTKNQTKPTSLLSFHF